MKDTGFFLTVRKKEQFKFKHFRHTLHLTIAMPVTDLDLSLLPDLQYCNATNCKIFNVYGVESIESKGCQIYLADNFLTSDTIRYLTDMQKQGYINIKLWG